MLKQRILQFAQARFHAIGRLHPDGTGGGGRESNSPASVMPAKPVLKTGRISFCSKLANKVLGLHRHRRRRNWPIWRKTMYKTIYSDSKIAPRFGPPKLR